MDQPGPISTPNVEAQGSAALALFALWRGCAPLAPGGLQPAFTLSGLVTSQAGASLDKAAALLASVSSPCCLVAGANDLSVPGAGLDVTIAYEPPVAPPTSRAARVSHVFPIGE